MYTAQDWNLLLTTAVGFALGLAGIIAKSKCFNARPAHHQQAQEAAQANLCQETATPRIQAQNSP